MHPMHDLARELFPICRSITGDGVRETLSIIKRELPQLKICEVPSGTKAFDWTVPWEWTIREAWIKNSSGDTIVDFRDSSLHVVGYSAPIDREVSLDELRSFVFTDDRAPDAIPYVTSYYKERSGYCMSASHFASLPDDRYRIFIDSELKEGSLTYGELLIPGESDEEIFLSTYICHPSLANDNISGPVVATFLCRHLLEMPRRRYSVRAIFIPETIGSIVYLSKHLDEMKKNVRAGFVITCAGDERGYSMVSSRLGGTLADRVLENVLGTHHPEYKKYPYLKRGSDERQYCAPGVDLPVVTFCRSKFGEFPEYHTSADDLDLITEEGLRGSLDVLKKCVAALEADRRYRITCLCEPQLGKRGLYPTTSIKGSSSDVRTLMDLLSYSDGEHDLISISDLIQKPIEDLIPLAERCRDQGLLEEVR